MLSPLLALLLAAPGAPLPHPTPPAADAAALYAEHCARCHGAEGDGKGWTELDRPARSFRDGGFSYGNTRGALVRSIRYGIPGTPMPAFPDEVLSAADRDALADFVIAFGPPGTVVEPGASVLRVEDRPAVVRGILPPLEGREGDSGVVPRGLLVGFPTGTTFEYRVDDVRLRAVRQGEFVDRRDWGDRGGLPLRPLGRVVLDTRTTAQPFTDESGAALTLRLAGTEVQGERVHVHGRLVSSNGAVVGRATETLSVAATDAGPVPVRTLRLTEGRANLPELPREARVEAAFRGADGRTYHVHAVSPGLFRATPQGAAADTVHDILAPRWLPALERAIPTEVSPR